MADQAAAGSAWPESTKIDRTVAHESRVYDYLLGGSTNFEVDRKAALRAGAAVGGIDVARASARSSRLFLKQVMHHLALEAGVEQFLDIGTGIPDEGNVLSVAQAALPRARVVSVDNDPIVFAHTHALTKTTPEGAADFVEGDLRRPDAILRRAKATLDLDRPVAVLLLSVLHHVRDADDPAGIVAEFMRAVPSGSYLAVSHLTGDMRPEEMAKLSASVPADSSYVFAIRSHDEIARFFDGLDLVDPGIVPIDQWRPNAPDAPHEGHYHYGALAQKP
ncbi:MAG TPA: SAM-dependent methyltransferase [Acidimicrobiales bacterium]|nr:SAM-dependent methyltransferase [Acidimicrobiales bacterium]